MDNREMVEGRRQGDMGIGFGEMNSVVDILNDLIAANRGIIDVYQTAAERLEIETFVELLRGFAEQHETFVVELSHLVVRHSGDPVTNANGIGLVKWIWVTLISTLSDGDGLILAEVAQDSRSMLEAYGEAVAADLPDDARGLVRRHMSQVRIAHDKLLSLSAVSNR
jgi:uncharacterized protein (TIGR02284 family)